MESVVEKPRRGWARRHWKSILAVWLGLALSGGALAFIMLRDSEATRLSVSTAEANPALSEQLGRSFKIGWFISGNIESNPGSGHAELAIPISGPKGSGTIYAAARKQAGLWHLLTLEFGMGGSSERVDLLPASEPGRVLK
jgi:Cytochrome oxidase complex assembly protein 1